MVLTPSGAIARVIRLHDEGEEPVALVEWPATGETANIRVKLLRRHGAPVEK